MSPHELLKRATSAVNRSYRAGKRDPERVALLVIRELGVHAWQLTPRELVHNATAAVNESYRAGKRQAKRVALVVIRECMAATNDTRFDALRELVTSELRTKKSKSTAVTIRKIIREGDE